MIAHQRRIGGGRLIVGRVGLVNQMGNLGNQVPQRPGLGRRVVVYRGMIELTPGCTTRPITRRQAASRPRAAKASLCAASVRRTASTEVTCTPSRASAAPPGGGTSVPTT